MACLAFACSEGASGHPTERDGSTGQSDGSHLSREAGAQGDAGSESLDGSAPDAGPREAGASDASTDASVDLDAALNVDAAPDSSLSCTEDPVCVLSAIRACTDAGLAERQCEKGCTAGACNTACDPEEMVVDQSQADDHVTIAPWQTFKLGQTGILTALEMRPNVFSPTGDPSTLTLSIYVGEGVGGVRLVQEQRVVASASGGPWQEFQLSTPVPLQAGESYTWEVLGGAGAPYHAKADVYADGHASRVDYDMAFRLHFAACH